MKHRNKQKNLFLHRSASVLISLMMALSVFMPNVLSVWAEEVAEDGEWTAEAETRSIPKPAEVNYRVTEGDGSTWTRGSGDMVFRFKRNTEDETTFSHFIGIRVDGNDVAASNYTAEAGSVIIRLHPQYLNTLSVGEHVLTALFDDGSSDTAHFTITEPKKDDTKPDSKVSDTSDRGALPALHWLVVMTASLLVMFIALRKRLIHR
ncbi:MAG: hypothetical protein E7185_02945 [Erysipelotrichaceae bacterium]|nr:hypothetical protein [Erysipelotrichaceae bacterium]